MVKDACLAIAKNFPVCPLVIPQKLIPGIFSTNDFIVDQIAIGAIRKTIKTWTNVLRIVWAGSKQQTQGNQHEWEQAVFDRFHKVWN